MAQSPKERKRAQRARDKEAAERRGAGGLVTVTLQISEGQRAALENCARVRSLGRSPLSPADYIELLIAEDVLKLGRQLKDLGKRAARSAGICSLAISLVVATVARRLAGKRKAGGNWL